MVFVRIKKNKGKEYYYLVENYRNSGKVCQKNLKYLGSVVPNSTMLRTLKEEFTEKKVQKIIREGIKFMPYKIDSNTLTRAKSIKEEFFYNLNNLSEKAKKQLIQRFKTGYTYHSCSIEGNTLTRQQVDMVINKKESVSGKKIIELREVENHEKAIEYMLNENSDLSIDFIKRLHKILTNGTKELKSNRNSSDYDPDFLEGEFRKDQRYIEGADFIPVIPELIEYEMKNLIRFYNENKYQIHPLELASEIHYRFVVIHPFTDGNGRMGRLLMNFILDRSGFPMIDISTINREKYLYALSSENTKNLTEFILLELENYINEVFPKKK